MKTKAVLILVAALVLGACTQATPVTHTDAFEGRCIRFDSVTVLCKTNIYGTECVLAKNNSYGAVALSCDWGE